MDYDIKIYKYKNYKITFKAALMLHHLHGRKAASETSLGY